VSDEENNESDSSGPATKPKSTDDLKRFLNEDPEDIPDAASRQPEFGPGGADANPNESDVGHGNAAENLVADQPLSAQQSEEDVPDEVQETEDVEEDGDEIQDSKSDPEAGKPD
jgi:hypothetical protein